MEGTAMPSWLRSLIQLRHLYKNPVERQRATGLLYMSIGLLGTWVLWLLFNNGPRLLTRQPLQFVPIEFVLPFVLGFIYWSVQRGQVEWASWAFIGLVFVGNIPPIISDVTNPQPVIVLNILMFVHVVAAGMLLNRRNFLLVGLATLMVIFYRYFLQTQSSLPPVEFSQSANAGLELVLALIALILTFFFLYVFSGNVDRMVDSSLMAVDRLEAVNKFIAEVGGLNDEDLIIARAIDTLRIGLGFTSVQVFFIDEDGILVRRMRSGLGNRETGAFIQLRDGDRGVIDQVMRTREMLVITENDSQRGHLIPPARSAAAIPLLYMGKLLGIVDVQSINPKIGESELRALQLMSDQLGVVISQERNINDLQRALREQTATTTGFQQQLVELRQSSSQAVTRSWLNYLEGRDEQAFGFDIGTDGSGTPVSASGIPESLRPTMEQGELYIENTENEQIINVPIIFRGETLGAMSFAVDKDRQISERQLDLAQIVSNRLGLALENTRLFEQSQAQALRERKASEVASLLIGATDVRSVLGLAAESFNEALGAVHTRVYLQPRLLVTTVARSEEA
jgi:GAF domain-containing protein